MLLGKRIRELRKKNNLTQAELGKLVNVTKVSICCYENGTRTPTLETLIDLSNVFKVNVNELIGYNKYIVSEKNSNYGLAMSDEEISFIKELRKHNDLYDKVMKDPKRMVELIVKKIRWFYLIFYFWYNFQKNT